MSDIDFRAAVARVGAYLDAEWAGGDDTGGNPMRDYTAADLELVVRVDHHDPDLDDHDVVERLDRHVERMFPGATHSYGDDYVSSVWLLGDGAILHVSYDVDSVTCWVEA